MLNGMSHREIWITILPVIITGLITLIVTVIGLFNLRTLRVEVNSRLTELIEVEKEKAKLEVLLDTMKKDIK